ncbi:septum formation protein [Thermoanaerobacter thermohydrosulfuricus]|uniref:dTTP/UTP pyrophosphatase n=3 Tax=Thermoanaerobacter TaxID=1754 RepID=G2MR01_9THEO|nr:MULTISPECIES: Maf family protein [Thermoanaerobacter]EGD50978.1 maf protein [Thermoanaerobacter ethanolicus JW 200]AEM78411.1 Septum formation protein Maf [Thermoanaerobacter wiegelii Rt8.B1]EMT38696.1 MAF protein [Thermoanaerobacter thermohydrosulfuricus WC1]SDG08270.1 septum formation protein [Thermoanaerobacter thermohydrosulfuricus]SFE51106.1 septum formation protein [Thermoanaerobacter thermohydrosulfuricus]
MKIVLASKSPRRRELLSNLGLDFEVIESNVEEFSNEKHPSRYVMDLSFNKAMLVAKKLKEEAIVIGADTIVVIEDKVLGKPKDRDEAYIMLKSLQGRVHTVYTGITIVRTKDFKYVSDFEETKVWIKKLQDEEIFNYIDTGECYDKAGAYAIQGFGALIVEKIVGDYFNVVGLPISKLFDILKREFDVRLL